MTTPRIYVGTYGSYNSGSIKGAWIDLEGHDKSTFYEACAELHADEADPEFMFQDYEGFPSDFYGESGLDDELWEWLEMDEDDRDMVAAFVDAFGTGQTLSTIRDAYQGTADSDRDFAERYVDDCGILNEIPDHLQSYFDMDAYSRDLMHDFTSSDGHYFNSNW
jgi:antirestriction protein